MYLDRVKELVATLGMQEHPEGGFFKEVFRSEDEIPGTKRNYMTSIYFLLVDDNVSHFHRIQADECWYYHEGSPLEVHEISPSGMHTKTVLGLNLSASEQPFTVVKGKTIFGSHVKDFKGYTLVSCAVAPGFDFEDFELFSRSELVKSYPHHHEIIRILTPNE